MTVDREFLESLKFALLDVDSYLAGDDKNKAWATLHDAINKINELLKVD